MLAYRFDSANPLGRVCDARIVSAVAPYPQAREAVIAALNDLDGESASEPELTDRSLERAENG